MKFFEIPKTQTYFATKEVVAITGMTKDALRYYEKIGVLRNVQRDGNNYRRYSHDDLERLRFVRMFQYLGLDLNLLANDDGRMSMGAKIAELKKYQSKVHQEQAHLAEIDAFLTDKIDYFNTHN